MSVQIALTENDIDAGIEHHERALNLLREYRTLLPALRQADAIRPERAELMRQARTIIIECCLKHGVSVEEIVSKRKTERVYFARQRAMYRLYNWLKLTKAEVGELFNRDHSTVINSLAHYEPDEDDIRGLSLAR